MGEWIFICLLYFSAGWQYPSPGTSYDLSWPSLGLFSHSLGSGWEKQEESLRDRDFRASKIVTDSFYRHQKLCFYIVTKEWAFPAGCREKLPSTSWTHTRCHTHPLLRFSSFCSVSAITHVVRLKSWRICCPDLFPETYLISPQSMLHLSVVLEGCQECNFQVFPGLLLQNTHCNKIPPRSDCTCGSLGDTPLIHLSCFLK